MSTEPPEYNMDDLKKIILDDYGSIRDNRYPVRLVFMNSYDDMRSFLNIVTDPPINAKIKDLTAILPSENMWLLPGDIYQFLEQISETSVLLPVSEFLRFQGDDDFSKTIRSLASIENTEKDYFRIYVPIVGLWSRFESTFWNKFYRKKEWAPVWKLKGKNKRIKVFQLDFDMSDMLIIDDASYCKVSTSKEWLEIWNNTDLKNIISTKNCILSKLYSKFLPDEVFVVSEMLSNQKEYVKHIYGIDIKTEFKKEEETYWNELISQLNRGGNRFLTLHSIFKHRFNISQIDELTPEQILNLYVYAKTDYDRWLIKQEIITHSKFSGTYLYSSFETLSNFDASTLVRILWTHIFSYGGADLDKISHERKILLEHIKSKKMFNMKMIERSLKKHLHQLDEKFGEKNLEKFKYLTDVTRLERKYLVYEISKLDFNTAKKISQEVYPLLYHYLNWDSVRSMDIDRWIVDYFEKYAWSKITDQKESLIEETLKEKNKDKSAFSEWYYSLKSPKLDEECVYIWVDGLGAEWFPLLINLLEEHGKKNGKYVSKKDLVRVSIPSTTKCNDYRNSRTVHKIDILDEHIHNENPYRYPDDLVSELELLEEISLDIINMEERRICVVSDHGFTFLCTKKFGNYKKLGIHGTEHEGRYVWIEEGSHADDDYYIVWDSEGYCSGKKAIIALKHISLENTPHREVHGGATPEEVIVPQIVISTSDEKIKYSVDPVDKELSILDPTLKIRIEPDPQHIAFRWGVTLLKINKIEDGLYQVFLENIKPGKHIFYVGIDDQEYPIKINIRGGFKESGLFE